MNVKKYISYTADELLNDSFFLESEQSPTKESMQFWSQLEQENSSLKKEITLARNILHAVKTAPDFPDISCVEGEELWQAILKENSSYKQKRRRKKVVAAITMVTISVAASLVLLFTLPQPSLPEEPQEKDLLTIAREFEKFIPADTENVTLWVDEKEEVKIEGDEVELDYQETGEVNINSKKGTLETEKKDSTFFHQLYVPTGKKSFLLLADGSRIWVNSNSKLIYPNRFENDKREIFIEGEIYIEVVSMPHTPFIVKTGRMDIEVRGTSFNVSAYKDANEQSVVLVEGAVDVITNEKETTSLLPDQRLCIKEDRVSIEEVDVYEFIGWKDNYYLFREEKLHHILSKIAQHYGIKISYEEDHLRNITCSGRLYLKEDLEFVLNTITKVAPIHIKYENENIKIYSNNF